MNLIESDAKEFIRRLPEISGFSVHLLALAIRSRLAKELMGIKVHDLFVERKIIRPYSDWRDNYFQRLENLATLQKDGKYYYKELPVPSEARAIFATITPRNARFAMADVLNYGIKSAMIGGDADVNDFASRFDVEFFAACHRHKTRDNFHAMTLDIDKPEYFKPVRDMVSSLTTWMVLQTSRGYHIVIDVSQKGSAEFHKGGGIWDKIHTAYGDGVELQHDAQEPVPGTLYHKIGSKEPNYVRIVE